MYRAFVWNQEVDRESQAAIYNECSVRMILNKNIWELSLHAQFPSQVAA